MTCSFFKVNCSEILDICYDDFLLRCYTCAEAWDICYDDFLAKMLHMSDLGHKV